MELGSDSVVIYGDALGHAAIGGSQDNPAFGNALNLGHVPLHDRIRLLKTGTKAVRFADLGEIHVVDSMFSPLGESYFAPKGVAEQLVAEAHTEIWLGANRHPLADYLLLHDQPWVFGFLPRVLRSTQREHEVERREIRYFFARPKADDFGEDVVRREEIEEPTGMVAIHVLEDKRTLHSPNSVVSGGSG